MTRFRYLTIAAAVAAALTAPTVLAQQGGSADPSRTLPQRDGTGMPSDSPTPPPGAVSQDPANDPNRRPGSDRTGSADTARTPQQRDGAGMPSGSPTQPPGATTRDRANDPTPRGSRDRSMGSPHGQYGAATVREVQQALQNRRYDVGPIDGVMGPRTVSALREFQQQQGLTRSGRIDAQTLSALEVQASGRSGVMGNRSSTHGTSTGRTGG